jgi:hypothetical protein
MTHEQLVEITRREVARYARYDVPRGSLRFRADDDGRDYAVIFFPDLPPSHSSRIVIRAQVVGEKVLIIEDTTDTLLVDVLLVNGKVPRQQIVLVYAGETVDSPQKSE